MKRISKKSAIIIAPLVIAITASFVASSARAQDTQPQPVNANDSTCFPMCASSTPTVEVETPKADACNSQSSSLIKQAEQLNDRAKPIKEIVGYVRSPQGLAIKLVNDHVVKIPAWVGYAMDPVGSLKNRAMDEVRTRAKTMVGLDRATANCAAQTAAPIDAALIPIDTQVI
jgi:hypothetical protein